MRSGQICSLPAPGTYRFDDCLMCVTFNHTGFFSSQDAVMDHIFELLLEFFSIHAHSIAFPEVALPAVLRVSNSNFVVYGGFRLS